MERFFVLDKFNTWYDLKLIITAKEITPPEPKTNYVEIDGANGSIDLSESLTGEVVYKDRTITASFWTDAGNRNDREKLMRKIVAALHGKKVKIIDPDDMDHYFYGRIAIKNINNIIPYMTFDIEATCEPWRYSNEIMTRTIDVSDGETISAVIRNNGVKSLCPEITVSGNVTIGYNGLETELSDGLYKVSSIKLRQGVNVITVSGTGSVTFTYREADL